MARFLVVGTRNAKGDDAALALMRKLSERFPNHEFAEFDPSEESLKGSVFIIDVAKGIEKVEVLSENDIDKLRDFPKTSAHDFDLAFSLKVAMLAGAVSKVRIVALPFGKPVPFEDVCQAVERAANDG